jgi:hypothetical protein
MVVLFLHREQKLYNDEKSCPDFETQTTNGCIGNCFNNKL